MQTDGKLMNQKMCGMVKRRRAGGLRTILCAIVLAGSVACISHGEQPIFGPTSLRVPDVHYEPTPPDVVEVMLRLANVKADDVVYDLGCGDGRIVITAVRQFGARAASASTSIPSASPKAKRTPAQRVPPIISAF